MEVMAAQPRMPPMCRFLQIDGASISDSLNVWLEASILRDVSRLHFFFGGLKGGA